MARYTCKWDSKGKLVEIQDGVVIWAREDYASGRTNASATVRGDLPGFISSIDGTMVEGHAAMREHCLKHNVVPTSDLAGLPPKQAVQDYKPDSQFREQTRRTIAEIMSSRGY